jgi:pSer/pThr/pTyr-binding forkhead associated (FHA) protein
VAPFNTGPSLVVISDGGPAWQIPIPFNGIVLGRDTELGPPFSTDEFVSRNHVSVQRHGDVVEVADLGSANGTFVNGTRVRSPARMQDSDVLRIGRIVLKLAAPGGLGQTTAKPARGDGPYLTILVPEAFSGRQFRLSGDYLVVGRDPASSICLNDPHVSRTHAALWRQGDAVYMQDLGSSSGTFVNGRPVTAACELRAGDIVAFAGVNARFDKVDEAKAAPRAPVLLTAAAIASDVERDRHVQHVMQQRATYLRGIAATRKRARRLVRTGLVSFVTGSAVLAAVLGYDRHVSGAVSTGAQLGGASPPGAAVVGLIGWAMGALGLALLIGGIVLHITAAARRRRVDREYPVGPWLGFGVGGSVGPGPFGKLSFLDDPQGDPAVPRRRTVARVHGALGRRRRAGRAGGGPCGASGSRDGGLTSASRR